MKEFFLDDFSRPIETVIKADDDKHTLQEVTEYVVTSEISKRLVEFFDAYLHDTSINGAWISGFFGSGKSHLLKILSFLLENELVDEKNIGEIFAEKIKDDPKLKADILKTVRDVPSESILFNIDQQATITSKTDQNAILQVFYKVFYDHLGFYGFLPQVAEFELYLSREGKYEQFIEEFNKLFRREWTDARLDTHDPEIEEALAEACGIVFNRDAEDYIGYLDTIEDRNRQSIEDLALKVNTYIESKPKNFRLNFFVDEVGQFIANNTKLMLNLQTIAETLNTKCKGRSWVIVTSQQDLESLIGDSTSEQSDDFSKIQGRFKVRMSLTSSNVDEVIEKRLLEKSERGKEVLGKVFQEEKENLRTLLTFSNVGVQFKGFKDQEEFVNKFPFLPYQFDLFQQCVKSLSTHSAFQGKHQSVGERSMLGVFQEVLKQGKIRKPGEFVSFDQMYEGLRGSLRSEIQSAILLSERQLSDEPLAIRVLKILFLVKYFGNFKTTAKNISILALSSKDQNPVTHLKEIKNALSLLEDQVYIERKGEEYEFLTDIEKDIESAVKDTSVEKSEMTRLIQQLVFDGVMGDSSIRYFENKQSFEYAKRVDGELYGRDKELKIEIITPLSDHYDNAAYLGSLSMGDTTLLVAKLPNERRLTQEVKLYLQTEKYLKQNQNGGTDESKSRIHYEKGHQNGERKRELQNLMNHQLSQATFYLNGTQHQVKGATDGKTRIIEAFQDLVKLAYHKLSLLGSTNFDETQVRLVFADKNQTALFGSTDTILSAPEQEVLNFIERKKRQHERISLSELKEHFSKKPYGWNYFAVWSVLGYLFKKGKIETRLDGNILESRSFLDALLNNRAWSNTLIEPQLEFNTQQTQFVKQIHQDAFNESNPHAEAKDIATYFKQKAKEEAEKIQALLKQANNYPFLQNLQALADLFQKLAKMDYPTLITTLHQYEDALLDDKENVYDPMMQFWNGEQRNIFDKMLVFQNGNQANFDYIDASEKVVLTQVQESATPYRGSAMREVKEAMDTLQERILSKIEEQRQATIKAAEDRITEIQAQKDFELLSELQQEALLKPFYQIIERSKTQNYIANLEVDRNNLSRLYTEQLNKLSTWTRKEEDSKTPKEQFVQLRQVERQVTTSKRQLETADDVQEYVSALKEVLLDQINNNRKITL